MRELFAAFDGATASLVQFAAFLLMGAAAGWLLARSHERKKWSAPLAMIGVCGAWMGAELACLFGQVDRGGAEQFLAALIGAGGLAYAWRRYHPNDVSELERLPLSGSAPR